MDALERLKELKKTWKAPAELERCRPREVQLTGAGRAVLALAYFLFAASIAATVLLSLKASGDRQERLELERAGRSVSAQVTRRWITSGDNKKYYIGYDYRVNGRTYTGRVNVGRRSWGGFPPGTAVPVICLPDDPRVHLVSGFEGGLMPLWLPLAIGPLILLGGGLVLYVLNGQRRLLVEGRAAPGIVTRVESSHSSDGRRHKVAHYAFLQLSGAVAVGKSGTAKKQPEEGSVVCVIYEPDRLRNNAIYPLSLVREVHTQGRGSGNLRMTNHG